LIVFFGGLASFILGGSRGDSDRDEGGFTGALDGSLLEALWVGFKGVSLYNGEGDTGGLFLLALFAFLLRNFSSSSDDSTSFSFDKLSSTLIVFESDDCTEAAPKEGARFNELLGLWTTGVAKESARLIRCTTGFIG
jgi:hypothetical protein